MNFNTEIMIKKFQAGKPLTSQESEQLIAALLDIIDGIKEILE